MNIPKIKYLPNNNHWALEGYRERVTRKQAQDILIDHPTIIFHGRMYWFRAKHVGAGVYEIYKEKMD
jgi:hypothetical protein